MRKFFTALVLIPLGLIFVVFAVANRHPVTVSFDPFGSRDSAFYLPPVPLFVIIIAPLILGGLGGGSGGWVRRGPWRRAARQHEADARQARAQLADLRAGATMTLRPEPQRLSAPSQGGWAAGRDKR